jgi:hypothetical protein
MSGKYTVFVLAEGSSPSDPRWDLLSGTCEFSSFDAAKEAAFWGARFRGAALVNDPEGRMVYEAKRP